MHYKILYLSTVLEVQTLKVVWYQERSRAVAPNSCRGRVRQRLCRRRHLRVHSGPPQMCNLRSQSSMSAPGAIRMDLIRIRL